MILAFLPDGGDDQREDGDNVGQHLQDRDHMHLQIEIVEKDIQRAEEIGSRNGKRRTPDGEDDDRDGEPSAVAESVVRPDAAGIVHHEEESAESRDHPAHARGNVLIFRYVNTGGVGCGRVFPDRAQMQSHARLFQNEGGDDGNDQRKVDHESVGEEERAEPAETFRERQSGLECRSGIGQRDIRNRAFHDLDQRAAEKVSEANAEGGQRETGHVLVGAERDGQKTVDQRGKQRADQAGKQRDQHTDRGNVDRGIFIEEGPDHARYGADIHDAGNAEVQVPGFLGDDLAYRSEEQRRTEHDGAIEKLSDQIHNQFSSFLRRLRCT